MLIFNLSGGASTMCLNMQKCGVIQLIVLVVLCYHLAEARDYYGDDYGSRDFYGVCSFD